MKKIKNLILILVCSLFSVILIGGCGQKPKTLKEIVLQNSEPIVVERNAKFDYSKIKILAIYSDKTISIVSTDKLVYEDVNTSKLGEGSILVSFENFSTVVKYRVIIAHGVTVEAGKNGTIAPGSCRVEHNTNKVFEVVPNIGYKISSIVVDGNFVEINTDGYGRQKYIFRNVGEDHNISATFEPQVFNVHLVNDAEYTDLKYTYGVGLELPTLSKEGYNFLGWFTDLKNGIKVDKISETDLNNKYLYAKWEIKRYLVNVTGDSKGQISPTRLNIEYGEKAEIYIHPYRGYEIDRIRVNKEDAQFSTDEKGNCNFVISNIKEDSDIVIFFKKAVYTITFKDKDENVLGTREYSYGDSFILEPVEKEGFTFKGWFVSKLGGKQIKQIEKDDYSDMILYARYDVKKLEIKLANCYNCKVQRDDFLVEYNKSTSFKVVPNDGFEVNEVLVNDVRVEGVLDETTGIVTFTLDNVIENKTISVICVEKKKL